MSYTAWVIHGLSRIWPEPGVPRSAWFDLRHFRRYTYRAST